MLVGHHEQHPATEVRAEFTYAVEVHQVRAVNTGEGVRQSLLEFDEREIDEHPIALELQGIKTHSFLLSDYGYDIFAGIFIVTEENGP